MSLEAPKDPSSLDFTESFETAELELNPEDILREVQERRPKIDELIEALNDPEAAQGQQSERVRQLKLIQAELGILAGKAEKAGASLKEEHSELRALIEEIEEATKLRPVQ